MTDILDKKVDILDKNVDILDEHNDSLDEYIDSLDKENNNNFCHICDLRTDNKYNFKRHLLTSKHIKKTKYFSMTGQKLKGSHYECICGKTYSHRQSLSEHRKKCLYKDDTCVCDTSMANTTASLWNTNTNTNTDTNTNTNTEDTIILTTNVNNNAKEEDTNMIKQILKQNQHLILENKEFKTMLVELASKPSIINNTNVNSHNKQFNLQVYLNETCKDAMNLSEFVDSLVIKASELEDMGRLGYAQGISNIIIRGLNEMDENKRPFHCTDKKRETIYIKENNVWEKEGIGRLLLRKMIRDIAHRNFKRMPQWMLDNPSCDDTSTKKHTEYMYIVNQVMTGLGPEDDNGINKIIRTVANYIYLDKEAIMMGLM